MAVTAATTHACCSSGGNSLIGNRTVSIELVACEAL